MRVLVTGGAGFIGSHISERLLRDGHEVVAFDVLDDAYDVALKRGNLVTLTGRPGFSFVEGDVLDPERFGAVLASRRFDAVLHLAARTGVRRSVLEPVLYERVNVQGTLTVLEAVRRHGAGRFVLASSSSVYGAPARLPVTEDDDTGRPSSPYAATKRAAELHAYAFHRLHGLDVTSLRLFTVYGPRQRPDMAIPRFAERILRGDAVPLFGGGASTRDYTYVDDVVSGIVAALAGPGGHRVYNLGASRGVRLSEVVSLLAARLGRTAVTEALPEQPGDVPETLADISKARRELGYEPGIQLEDGLARYAAWRIASTSGGLGDGSDSVRPRSPRD